MDDLDLGTCLLLLEKERQGTQSVIRGGSLRGGNFAVKSVATFSRNGWQLSGEMGGNFHVKYANSWKVRNFQLKNVQFSIEIDKLINVDTPSCLT